MCMNGLDKYSKPFCCLCKSPTIANFATVGSGTLSCIFNFPKGSMGWFLEKLHAMRRLFYEGYIVGNN